MAADSRRMSARWFWDKVLLCIQVSDHVGRVTDDGRLMACVDEEDVAGAGRQAARETRRR